MDGQWYKGVDSRICQKLKTDRTNCGRVYRMIRVEVQKVHVIVKSWVF
jgi:hypothetical protein